MTVAARTVVKGLDVVAGASHLFGRLHPDAYALVWDGSSSFGRALDLTRWSDFRIGRLERLNSLDSLTCLVVLLRLAAERGDTATAFQLSRALCRALLVNAPWLIEHGIAMPLAEYVQREILPLAMHEGACLRFWSGNYCRAAVRLHDAVDEVLLFDRVVLTRAKRKRLAFDLLDPMRWTHDLCFLIEEVKVVDPPQLALRTAFGRQGARKLTFPLDDL